MGGHGASRWDLIKAWWASARVGRGRTPVDVDGLGGEEETTALAGHGWDDDPTFDTSGTNPKPPPLVAEDDAREIDDADLSVLRVDRSARKGTSSTTSDSTHSRRRRLKASELELVQPPQDGADESQLAAEEEAVLRKERRRARRKARELGLWNDDLAQSEQASVSDRGLEVPNDAKNRNARRRRESERGEGSSRGSSDRRGSAAALDALDPSETSSTGRPRRRSSRGDTLSPTLGSDHGSSSRRRSDGTVRRKKKSRTSQASPSSISAASSLPAYPSTVEVHDPVHVYYSWCAAYAETYGVPVDEATAGWLWAKANGVDVEGFEPDDSQSPTPMAGGDGDETTTPREGATEEAEAGEAEKEARLNLSSEDFLKALKATKLPPPPPPSAPTSSAALPPPPPPPPSNAEGLWSKIVSAATEVSEASRKGGQWDGPADQEGGWGRWQEGRREEGEDGRGETEESHSEHESS